MKKSSERAFWIGGLIAAAGATGVAVYFIAKPKAPAPPPTTPVIPPSPLMVQLPNTSDVTLPSGQTLIIASPNGTLITNLQVDTKPQVPVIVGGQGNATVGQHRVFVTWTDTSGASTTNTFLLTVT